METSTTRERLKLMCMKHLQERLAKVSACSCEQIGGNLCLCEPQEFTVAGHVSNGRGLSEKASLASAMSNPSTNGGHSGNEFAGEPYHSFVRHISVSHDSEASSTNPAPNIYKTYVKYDQRPNLLKSMSMEKSICHKAKRGYLLLINNVHFHGMLLPRNGAEQDENDAMRFFQRAGFYINQQANKTRDEMQAIFASLAADQTLGDYDTFALLLMSHGNERGVLGVDNKPFDVDDIVSCFKGDNCKALIGMPKLFFIQACRGNSVDRGVPYVARGLQCDGDDDEPIAKQLRIPTDADIMIAFSTTPGNVSVGQVTEAPHIASQLTGSWFVSCMIQIFENFADDEDLMSMMTRVNLALSQYGDALLLKQIPCQVNMLRKKVVFVMRN